MRSHSSGISAVDALGGQRLEALEDVAEHLVELVEVALVLHQDGARQIVEVVDAVVGDVLLHALHQGEVLLDGDRHLGRTQFEEEVGEHGALPSLLALLPAGHEGQPLEEVHVLLVLEQRAVQRRDELLGVLRRSASGDMSSTISSFSQSSSSEVDGFFFRPGTSRMS